MDAAALLPATSDVDIEAEGPLALYGRRLAVARASRAQSMDNDRTRLVLDLVRLRARAKGGR